ncbi:MAG TPA: amidohydrolase family protein, partial [Gaiellaceae bacterium]|nr:amidohydrolase family protein [Gaiellaceae bacterium]
MAEPLDRAHELFSQFEAQLRSELPAGVDIFDAHVHLGDDIDGMAGRYEELLALMDRYGISRCNMFCLDEPDRGPGFRSGNDRTLAFAARSEGRLIPYVRLALDEGPIEEATRCLDLGARGIKLHPRAQKFLLNDERLAPVFELAEERRVPILIHGGRGLPPIADNLHRLVDAYPGAQLIIAHAGIADLTGLAGHFAGKAGVFFDTSVWSPIDLLSFFRLVPPEQVLYASDYPYGQQPASLLISLRTARFAGMNEQQIEGMLSGNANRIANGEPPLAPS